MTTLIDDRAAGKVRTSQNLAGLYNHARRVARREGLPLSCSIEVVSVEWPKAKSQGWAANVRVTYAGRHGSKNPPDTGVSHFADLSIARAWAKSFAAKRGGNFFDLTLTTPKPAVLEGPSR